jgi:hypothetical protein
MRSSLFAAAVALAIPGFAPADAENSASPVAVAPQYDSTHVYVQPDKVDQFVESFLATFGGQSTKQVVTTVTPTRIETEAARPWGGRPDGPDATVRVR